MEPKTHVRTHINGEPVEFLSAPHRSLLEVLRDDLMLTGTKEGCTSGDCGACSVTLDGRLVCACLVLAVEIEGRSVGTVEGLACEKPAAAESSRPPPGKGKPPSASPEGSRGPPSKVPQGQRRTTHLPDPVDPAP